MGGVEQAFPRECANLSHCESGSECSYHCTLGKCSGEQQPRLLGSAHRTQFSLACLCLSWFPPAPGDTQS